MSNLTFEDLANGPTVINSSSLSDSTLKPYFLNNMSIPSSNRSNVADVEFDKFTRVLLLYIFIVLGTIGGILVFLWLWYNRRRKSRVNKLILNVTISDLSVIFFSCLMQLVWESVDRNWYAGMAMCKILKFLQSLAVMASNNMLVILSFDRHQAIRSPLREPIKVWKLVSLGWFLAGLFSLPQFYIFHTAFINDTNSQFFNKTVCQSIFRYTPPWHRTLYLTYIGFVVFYIPLVLISVFYVRIFLKISSKVRESSGTGKEQSKPGKVRLVPSSSSSISKAKIKTLKMTIVIVVTFIICTAPYQILETLLNIDHTIVPKVVNGVLGSLVVANSSINPFIFLLFNANASCVRWFIKIPGRGAGYETTATALSTRTEYTIASTHVDMNVHKNLHTIGKASGETLELSNVKNKSTNDKSGKYHQVATS